MARSSRHYRRGDDDYTAVISLLLDGGADHIAWFNRWGEHPESMRSGRIAALLGERGFPPPRGRF